MTPTWDILICTIERRTDKLTTLLEALVPQIVPGVGVHILRDNLEHGYCEACNALVASAEAEYICFVDDDDMVSPNYVARIVEALESRPDMVGFEERYTVDGVLQMPVYRDLRAGEWRNEPNALYRDLSQGQPGRLELYRQVRFATDNGTEFGADQRWVADLRALGIVKTQVYIPEQLYYYQCSTSQGCLSETTRTPMTEHPPRPDFPFVTWI
jgi:glycosyltransferase involved in cell wall biosynthesis